MWKDVHLRILMFISHSKRNTFYWGLADLYSIRIGQKPLSIIMEYFILLEGCSYLQLVHWITINSLKNRVFAFVPIYCYIVDVWLIGACGILCFHKSLRFVKRLSVCFWGTNLPLSLQVYEFIFYKFMNFELLSTGNRSRFSVEPYKAIQNRHWLKHL